jgi:hypothetical protein
MVAILFVWLKAAGTENVRNNTAVGIKSTAIYSLLRRTQGEREKKTNSLHFFLFLSDACVLIIRSKCGKGKSKKDPE